MVDIINHAVDPHIPWVAIHTVKPKQHHTVRNLLANAPQSNQRLPGRIVILLLELHPEIFVILGHLFHIAFTIAQRCR